MKVSASSVHMLSPTERGGTRARRGLAYQDHVAAALCVEMLAAGPLTEVWCEVLDDITLIWHTETGEEVEFVQVKSDAPPPFWSISRLCARQGSREGTSVLERSLAHARCSEPCRFRIVTHADIARDLRLLTLSREHPDRAASGTRHRQLVAALVQNISDVKSPNGDGVDFWAIRCLWEVRGTDAAVKNQSLVELYELLHAMYGYLGPDQVRAVYEMVVARAFEAATADPETNLPKKKILASTLGVAVQERIVSLRTRTASTGVPRLREALTSIGLSEVDMTSIVQLHWREIAKPLRQPFLSVKDFDALFYEVETLLTDLRTRRLAAERGLNDLEFHNECVETLTTYWSQLPVDQRPSINFLKGIMYELVARGLHYFSRPETAL